MAQRRMFRIDLIENHAFDELSKDARLLYVYLGLNGDDDGFVRSPKRIARGAGIAPETVQELSEAGFVIPFASGVVVITDWLQHNLIRADSYNQSLVPERDEISVSAHGKYLSGSPEDTGEASIDEYRQERSKKGNKSSAVSNLNPEQNDKLQQAFAKYG